ncbi:hypothetical protein N0V90_013534 [Kalmusia sp. IMI 367209]|nr:hypothetical protein N0V90_013534 [Kalmusia sp. IMI 367209]
MAPSVEEGPWKVERYLWDVTCLEALETDMDRLNFFVDVLGLYNPDFFEKLDEYDEICDSIRQTFKAVLKGEKNPAESLATLEKARGLTWGKADLSVVMDRLQDENTSLQHQISEMRTRLSAEMQRRKELETNLGCLKEAIQKLGEEWKDMNHILHEKSEENDSDTMRSKGVPDA